MFVHPAAPFAARPPWRPWRAGPPRFAVGAAPAPERLWLRPDAEHAANMANRQAMLAGRFGAAVRWDEESAAAQAEARALIEAALGEHAPASGEPDIVRAGRLLADDLVVMEKRDGAWRATALLLTAPTFFSAEDAFGKDLAALHAPVPGGAPGLSGKIGALFDRMGGDTILQRFNWTLQCGAERFTPDGAPLRERAAALGPEAAAAALHLRVERQTVRRLPETGAVLFTIRVCLDRLGDLDGDEIAVVAAAWRAGSDAARAYKRWDALEEAAEIAFARG